MNLLKQLNSIVRGFLNTTKEAPCASLNSRILIGDVRSGRGLSPLWVNSEMLDTHALFSGETRMGKSRLATSLLLQKIQRGEKVIVIDPHGTLFRLLQKALLALGAFEDETFKERVWFVDIPAGARKGLVPGFNILEQDLPVHTIALGVLDAFHRTFTGVEVAAAFDQVVVQGCSLLIHHNLPLTFLPEVLVNRDLRKTLLTPAVDPAVVSYFRDYFIHVERGTIREAASTERRIRQLLFSPIIRNALQNTVSPNLSNVDPLLEQEKSLIISLDFPDVVSKRLWGSLLLVAIEQAVMHRMALDESLLTPYTLFIDEFPLFISTDESTITDFLQQTAKAKFSLWLCHQNLSTIPLGVQGALDNCALRFAFHLGENDARTFSPLFHRFNPYLVKDQLPTTMGMRRTYVSHDEQRIRGIEELMTLKKREVRTLLPSGESYFLQTPEFADVTVDTTALNALHEFYFAKLFQPQELIAQQATILGEALIKSKHADETKTQTNKSTSPENNNGQGQKQPQSQPQKPSSEDDYYWD